MSKQVTLSTEIAYTGVGLHSGRPVHLRLVPAPVDTGLVFVRTDVDSRPHIRAIAANVTSTLRATTVEEGGYKVFTIEHLMSALHAMGVDNCYIEMDSEEPPVADGSALEFSRLIEKAGIVEQDAEAREIVIDKIYRIDDEQHNRFVMALPYDGFRVSFTSVNPHKLIGIQYQNFEIDRETYLKEIAPARTIAYEQEVKALQEMGLGLGGTLDSVIVYNDEGWINPLHYDDELVRHKIVDLIGDLRLAGKMKGHFIAVASGHALNTALAKQIAAAQK